MKANLRLFCCAVWLLLMCQWAFAQGAATGDLHVTVRDPKGGIVTNATVTARDQARAFERSTTANVEGEYRLLALPPGTYTVRVEAAGFAVVEAENQAVTVGQMRDLPINLSVAGTKETIDRKSVV